MTLYKNAYTAIRSVPIELAELSWSMGLPLLGRPEREEETPVYKDWNALVDGNETLLRDHQFETGCGLGTNAYPEHGGSCRIHAQELADLMATSPKPPEIFFEGQTIDTHEETIRQEAARLGIKMMPAEDLVDDNDEMIDDVKEAGYAGSVPFWAPDASAMASIAWERSVKMSGPVVRCYAVVEDGEIVPRVQGAENDVQAGDIVTKWVEWLTEGDIAPHVIRDMPQHRQDIIALSRAFRTARGKGLQVSDITGEPQAPLDYFWIDVDPYRATFHEDDMEMHDVHIIRYELSDREIAEAKEAGLPPIGQWLIHTRGHDAIRTIGRVFVDAQATGWQQQCNKCNKMQDYVETINGSQYIITHCKACNNALTETVPAVTHKVAALSNIALHPIHMDGGMQNMGSDTEIASAEWDLGEDLISIEDLYEEQEAARAELEDDPWVS